MDIIGRREMIHLPEWGGFFIPAKIDTGAFRTAVHCDSYQEKIIDGKPCLEVKTALGPHSMDPSVMRVK